MGEFAVVIALVGVSVLIIIVLLACCKLLSGWSFVKSWITGSREETAVLTKSEHFNINGYSVRPETNYGFEDTNPYMNPDLEGIRLNQSENVPPEFQAEQTTSFITTNETKPREENPFDSGFQYSSPSKRPPLERGESLSARLGKGQAPLPPAKQNDPFDSDYSDPSTRNEVSKYMGERKTESSSPKSNDFYSSASINSGEGQQAGSRRYSRGRFYSQNSTDSNSDFPDYIAELESGESPKIKRAMSCDSVSSETSVVLETLEDAHTKGDLEIGIQYDKATNDLIVVIIQAHNLASPDPTLTTLDSYIQVFLLPDKTTSKQTNTQRKTVNPVYKEMFGFRVKADEISNRSILCRIFSMDKHIETLIGEVQYPLSSFDTSKSTTVALPVTNLGHKFPELGEIMFSLSYLPTAERLTIVIVKARNLTWTHNKKQADPFVKVYLLEKGKKAGKKKTSVKKNDINPIFNEAMIFSVPASRLQTIQLRVTVAEYQVDGKAPSIGHVFVGTQATGKSLSHWNQMMSSLRKPIAMWHPLRK